MLQPSDHTTSTRSHNSSRSLIVTTPTASDPTLVEPFSTVCDLIQKCPGLAINSFHIRWVCSTGCCMARDRLRSNRHHLGVTDRARGFPWLPFRVQQVFGS